MRKPLTPGGAFIRSVRVDLPEEPVWPFIIPAVHYFGPRTFHPGAGYLVGKNHSGKSTVIESLAIALLR